MNRKILSLLLLFVFLLSACSQAVSTDSQTEPEANESDKPVIGLVMKSLGAEFFKAMEEGAILHAEERGDLELIPLGTQSQSELDQQIAIVENLTSQGVDAIIIAPMDSKALVSPIAKAIEAGIEVINIDVPLDADAMEAAGIELAFVGPDNVGAAKVVGDVLGQELGEGGKVIIIEGLPGAENAQQRKEGFMQSVEEYGLEVLASQTANWEAEEANTVFTNLLTAHPDVEGVMCANDAMALGVVQALDAAGLSGEIKVVGFDNDPSIRPLIQEGKVLATIDQFGSQMAAFGIDYAMAALDGEKLTGWIKTEVELITAEDFDVESSETTEDDQPVIGLVMKSLGAEFFKAMEEGAILHAEERGDLELIPLGTQSQSELDQQIAIVENLTAQGVDAIIIAPMDSKALVSPIAKAIEAGIEVINIDVPLDADAMEAAGIDLAFVGPDNVGAAKVVGDVLGQELGEGGKVIIIEGLPGAENAQQRKEGFMLSVEEYGLEVLASQTANWEAEEANTVFTNLLTAHPDVEGVMCANDAMALGVVQALDAAGLSGEIKVVGFDNDPSIRPLIQEGKVLATIDQFGSQMAAFGIDYAMAALDGEKLTGWIKTEVELITAEDFE